MTVTEQLPRETCKRCGHTWIKRVVKPVVCPKCQSPYWDKDRVREMKNAPERA